MTYHDVAIVNRCAKVGGPLCVGRVWGECRVCGSSTSPLNDYRTPNCSHITDCRDNRSLAIAFIPHRADLNKGVPPLACFDWRGWFIAGLPFFRGYMTLRVVP
ncbi:hypothetical protein J6590_067577 [Homalodisca vitripennis]|nr:hypothetical protein J6590_067577 [Homalodisca vitripennis]